eukprot:gene22280-8818_t
MSDPLKAGEGAALQTSKPEEGQQQPGPNDLEEWRIRYTRLILHYDPYNFDTIDDELAKNEGRLEERFKELVEV